MSRIRFGVWVVMGALILVSLAFSQKVLTTIQIGGFTGTPAVNTATNMIYVPNTTTGDVAVIDGKTNKIVTTIPVGVSPYAIAVANPVTNLIYVAAGDADQYIAVIDGSTNTVIETIPVPEVGLLAVNEAANLIYFQEARATLAVLDGATNQVTNSVVLSTSCCIQSMVYSPFTNRIYGTLGISDNLAIINAADLSFTTVYFEGNVDIYGLAADSTSGRVYLGNASLEGLYVVNGMNGEIGATIQPDHFAPIAVNPTNHLIADIGFSDQNDDIFLSFANGHNYASVGNQIVMPKNQTPYAINVGVNNRYYVTFYQHDGVMVISGP